ncbi:MAG: hypothetical protein R2838_22165 [Caldilineaceae bacterium]
MPFITFDDDVGAAVDAGGAVPNGWRPLTDLPLVILVGVTGVGKSTTIAALAVHAPDLHVLPDRRTLTDALIIAHVQQADGAPPAPVTDRAARFAYTRRYRTHFPGGMAHAVAQLRVAPHVTGPLLFDGLRGADEVHEAVTRFPHAVFVVLDAPDAVRVQRLLGRGDAFDQIQSRTGHAGDDWTALGVPEAAARRRRTGPVARPGRHGSGDRAELAAKLRRGGGSATARPGNVPRWKRPPRAPSSSTPRSIRPRPPPP